MSRVLSRTVFVAPLLVAAPLVRAEDQYQIVALPTLDGHLVGSTRLNNRGDVGGSVNVAPDGSPRVTHPFLYTAGGGITDLGLIPNATSGFVNGLNGRGDATVVYDMPDGTNRAYVYSGGTLSPIPLPAGATAIRAAGIDDAGRVVGAFDRNGVSRPYLFVNGTLTELPLPAAATATTFVGAGSINAAGQILGSRSISIPDISGLPVSFLWNPDGTMTEITPPGDWSSTGGARVNDLGHVAGDLGKRAPTGGTALLTHPYLYRDGVVTDLGTVPGLTNGVTVSRTLGLNNHDDIVGQFYRIGDINVPTHAFLNSDGQYTDLSVAVTLPDGYRLTGASAINDLRQILVTGTQSPLGVGPNQTFLLTPTPEPAAVALAVMWAPVVLSRCRRR